MSISQIRPMLACFTSYDGDQNTRCFSEGSWGSATRRPQVVEAVFHGVVRISHIIIPFAGSDMTVDRARIVVRLRTSDGGYTDIKEWREATIGRGYGELPEGQYHFSNDEGHPNPAKMMKGWELKRNSLPPQTLKNEGWPEAIALQVFMEGHGWFAMRGVEIFGVMLEFFHKHQHQALENDYRADLKVIPVWAQF